MSSNTNSDGSVELTVDGRIATILISRPAKRNAVTIPMWQQITAHINTVIADHTAEAIVLRGSGDHFSAGGDLSEILAVTKSAAAAREYCRTVVTTLHTLANCPIPTISAIRGVAAGGGVELALATEFRLAAHSASMRLPMSHLGVVPDGITIQRLVEAVGNRRAHWMLATGRKFHAASCLAMGLIDEVSDDEDLDATVHRLIVDLSRIAPAAHSRSRAELRLDQLPTIEQAAEPMIAAFLSGEVRRAAENFVNRPR